MTEEEDEWFPKVREALGRNQLQDLGDDMRKARKNAPQPPQRGAIQKAVDAVFN